MKKDALQPPWHEVFEDHFTGCKKGEITALKRGEGGKFPFGNQKLKSMQKDEFLRGQECRKTKSQGPQKGGGKNKEGLSVNVGTATAIFWLFSLHVCKMRGLKEVSVMKLSAVTSMHNQLRSKSAEYHGN